MNHWIFLTIAIVAEVVATTSMKMSDGFTRLMPSLVVIAGYAIAFYCMAQTLRIVPVGVVYAIWSGVGIVFITAIGWRFFGQKLDTPALLGMALIISGVVVMNLFSKSVAH